ncbi:hypothetical protein [Fundidesulfovibrio terrae]|uniref:hypothetical protein n=1 Tax=Fundidesulfovibrio terrae TaxID=2922866 RepID=UPI001FAF2FC0|nr:hypothetical protein [Fundidesulfovibrio terrae]
MPRSLPLLLLCLALSAPAFAQGTGDVWPTTPGAPPPPSIQDRKAKAEQKGRELNEKLGDDEALIRKYVRRGMGVDEVRELLGEPRGFASSERSGRYLCLGYGRVWVVFEDGVAACLRSRLEYVSGYDSNCHCAGNALNMIPFGQP